MLPLAGVKVVEIAENLAGPYAGQILALRGADVLPVDPLGFGVEHRAALGDLIAELRAMRLQALLDLRLDGMDLVEQAIDLVVHARHPCPAVAGYGGYHGRDGHVSRAGLADQL